MTSLSQRWTSSPGWVRWPIGILLTIVFYGLAYALVASVFDLDPAHQDLAIRWLLVALSLPLFVVGVLWQRRRLGGKGQLRLYRRAYRTGTIPEGAKVDAWRPVVRRQLRFFREARRVQQGFWAVLGALLVISAVVGLVAADNRALVGVLVASSFALVAAIVLGLDRLYRWRVSQFTRLQRALDDLEGRSTAGPAS